MERDFKLRLQIPYKDEEGRYFSLLLKPTLENESSEYSLPSKMFLISDIEGNFLAMQRLLVNNHVIDRKHNWTFDDGHLVIVGDCFDKDEQVIECLWLIYSLEDKAKREGGYVHFVLGNQEIMNLNGDWRYKHPKYAKSTRNGKKITALYDGNNMLWNWLVTKNIIERIGDVLVVHGGISPALSRLGYSIPEINECVRPYYSLAMQAFTDPLLDTVLGSDQSPLWYSGYYHSEITQSEIDTILSYYNVNAIITGHTIVDTITAFYNKKIVNIGTNHGRGKSEALLITNGQYFRANSSGGISPLQ